MVSNMGRRVLQNPADLAKPRPAAVLPSWRVTPTRQAIVDFVAAVTAQGEPTFVPPAERVAVFDNDGTLWCEKPMPIQVDFILRSLATAAEQDVTLRDRQPWQAAYTRDYGWLGESVTAHYRGDDANLRLLVAAVGQTFAGAVVEDYELQVDAFLDAASHPTLGRPYRDCGYQPMIELLRYLEQHEFTCYVVSGGDRDFMRPVARRLYDLGPERVIGSTFAVEFQGDDSGGAVMFKDKLEFFDDGSQKPARIWSRVGRRPILACGNSNGDVPMLSYAGRPGRSALQLLVHHDDPDREPAYDAGAEQALAKTAEAGWTVISVRDDWSTVFAAVPDEAVR
jgi:phosphoglycolate phosphatase-like HAD superfamily hydrolase